jgi:hypothetical protein
MLVRLPLTVRAQLALRESLVLALLMLVLVLVLILGVEARAAARVHTPQSQYTPPIARGPAVRM